MEKQEDVLFERGVFEIIGQENLQTKLKEGKKLRVKLGIDPTSPNLHLGRSIPLLKVRDFQNAGHQIVFIVGDFTGTIGDTSDKESGRPMLTSDFVLENMRTYLVQISKLIDIKKAEIKYNSEWLKKLDFATIGELADIFSINEFISRDLIKRRLDDGKRVVLREVLYPLMQGYDSLMIDADIELGGTDQRFNMLAGREIQKHFKKSEQAIILNKLINGTDGNKMSSSVGNTINFLDEPKDMFGKIMSVVDSMIVEYFDLLTRVPRDEIKSYQDMLDTGTNPRDVKIRLAYEIVKMYHGQEHARDAEQYFISTFTNKEIPHDIQDFEPTSYNIIDILLEVNFAESRGEARRLIEQEGIKLNGVVETKTDMLVSPNTIIQKGKRFFIRIV